MKRDSPFHPYAQGPKGENVGSITQPLPSNYLIFRATSESDGEVYVCSLISWTSKTLGRRSFPSLKCGCVSRPVLDGCSGAGSQLLQSLQADSQSWERSRYQHVFRVLPYTPPAAVHCTQWYRAVTVRTQCSCTHSAPILHLFVVLNSRLWSLHLSLSQSFTYTTDYAKIGPSSKHWNNHSMCWSPNYLFITQIN